MKSADVQKLAESIEYSRAKFRLTRVTDPELRARCMEIVRRYEMRQHIAEKIKTMKEKNDTHNS